MKKSYITPYLSATVLSAADMIAASGDKILDLNDFENGDSVDFVIS